MQEYNSVIEVLYKSFYDVMRESVSEISENIVFVKSFVHIFLRHNELEKGMNICQYCGPVNIFRTSRRETDRGRKARKILSVLNI